jgi:hypothetical protein
VKTISKPKFNPKVYVAMREKGLNNTQIADELGVSEAAVRRGLRKAGFKPYLLPTSFMRRMQTQVEKPLVIDVAATGGVAITADWHHPLADYGLVNTFLDHAVDVGCTKVLAVAGDWFNIDSLSQFDSKQDAANLPREIEASTETMARVLEVFDEVVLSWGNHDARLHKALGYKVPFAQAMRMLFTDLDQDLMQRITISNLDHIYLESPRGRTLLAHPKSYSSTPLTSARKIAGIKLCNVILGHSHHTAVGHDPSGSFVVAEIGGFFDRRNTEYLQRTTTYPNWQNGYGFMDAEGYLTIEGEGWSSRIGRTL